MLGVGKSVGQAGSPCVEAGSTALLPADAFDLDGDGDTAEYVPFDIAGEPRVQGRSVDMGAYESGYLALDTDFNNDDYVDGFDTIIFHACMSGASLELEPGCEPADLDFDGDVDQSDFGILQGCLSGSYVLPDPACVD